MSALRWIEADWPAPAGLRAVFTTRQGGVSTGAHASLNLGGHVGDMPAHVAENRRRLREALALPAEPYWLDQVHGTDVAHAGLGPREADAAVTSEAGQVLAVMTADCLPVALASRDGRELGLAHAGWRGLASGVLEATVSSMATDPGELRAWLGPAIGPDAFEVGPEVREAFLRQDAGAATCFRPSPAGRWLADLAGLARLRLAALGIHEVHGGGPCTHAAAGEFFSHRRDGTTGRMAALLWRE